MNKFKENILKVLVTIWMVIIPILLAGFFAFGCFMALWKIIELPLAAAILIGIILLAGVIMAVTKMIRLW